MLQFERFGQGAQMYVGIHGWGGSSRSFAPLWRSLPADLSFFALDLPGYRGTPAPREWGFQPLSREIALFLEQQVPPGPLCLVGNCSGAIFALGAAQHCQRPIHRVAMLDAFAFMPWYLRMLAWPVLGPLFYYSSFGNPLGRWITNRALAEKREADTDLTSAFEALDLGITYRYLRLLAEVGSHRQFGDLQLEVDLLTGPSSFGAIEVSTRLWLGLWPEARHFPLSKGGHLLLQENAEEVCDILFE